MKTNTAPNEAPNSTNDGASYRDAKLGALIRPDTRNAAFALGEPLLPANGYRASPKRLPIAALRDLVKLRLSESARVSLRWHQLQKEPAKLRFARDFAPPRFFLNEEAGAGKTTAFVDACAENLSALRKGFNIVAFVKNTKNALALETKLVEALSPRRETDRIINCMAADKLCHNDEAKPKISKCVKAGHPVADVCSGCKLKDECKYQRSLAAQSGKILIYQMAHMKVGALSALTQKVSGPVLLSFVDESPISEMAQVVQLPIREINSDIKVVPKRAKPKKHDLPGDLERRQRAANTSALEDELALNRARAYLHDVARMMLIPREDKDQLTTRARVPMTCLAGAFGQELGAQLRDEFGNLVPGPPISIDKLQTPVNAHVDAARIGGEDFGAFARPGARERFNAEVMRKFRMDVLKERPEGYVDEKWYGYAAKHLRKVDAIAQIMLAIDKNHGRKDHLSTIVVTDYYARQKKGDKRPRQPTRTIGATVFAEVPAVIRSAPIVFCDATGDKDLLGLLLGEETAHWEITSGKATRPFATTTKIFGQPSSSSQLREHKLLTDWLAARVGRVKVDSQLYENGEATEDNTRPTINLNTARAHSAAKNLERLVMVLAHERQGKRGGLIAPKTLAEAITQRSWARKAGLVIGHHGAVAGKNDWAACDYLIVIGQFRPPVWAAEDLAMGLALNDPMKRPISTTGKFERVDAALLGANAWMRSVTHADPLVAAVLEQLCEAQQRQAYDRLRMTNRSSEAEYCELIAVDNVATNIEWDRFKEMLPVNELDAFEAIYTRTPSSAVDAARTAPELFANSEQARKRLREIKKSRTEKVDHKSSSPARTPIENSPPILIGDRAGGSNCGPVCSCNRQKRGRQTQVTVELLAALQDAINRLGRSKRKLEADLKSLGYRISATTIHRLLVQHPELTNAS